MTYNDVHRGWYPWVICHAVALVDDLPVFRSLPDSYCQVLRRLIKKVGKDDGQRSIFAKRQTLASETGKSVETVYRALREFETKGWIEQREKRAREGLIGSDSEIVFTKTLCDLLALPYEGKKLPTRSRSSVSADRSNKAIVISSIQSSSKKHPSEISEQKNSKRIAQSMADANPEVVRVDGKSVPKDLAWLVLQQGLSLSGLFALMKLARAHGKKLSDVVSCVSKHLEKLQGRGLFAYLNKLVLLERDFAWEVKERAAAANEQSQQAENKRRMDKASEKLHGQWFMSRKSGAIFEVDGCWVRMISFDESGRIRNGTKPMAIAFIDAIEAGALVRCEAGSTPVMVERNDD